MNPIKTSDLLQDDGAISKTLSELEEIQKIYSGIITVSKKEAAERLKALKTVNIATEEQREEAAKQLAQIEQLSKQYDKYNSLQTETAKKIAAVKVAQSNLNKLNKLEAKLNIAKVDSYEAMSAELLLTEMRLKQLTNEEKKNTEEGKKLVKRYKTLNKNLEEHNEIIGKTKFGTVDLSRAFENLPGPLETVRGGVGKVGGAFRLLLANPVVAFIAAVVTGLTALFNAFLKGQKGQDLFNEKLEQTKAVIDVLQGRLSTLAEAAILLLDGKLGAAADKTKQAFTGVKNEISEAIVAAKELNDLSIAIEEEQIAIVQQSARLRRQIKDLNKTAEDTTENTRTREKAARRAIELSRALLNAEQSLLDLQRDRVQKEIESSATQKDSREALLRLAEANAAIENKETEILELQTTLQNKLNTIRQDGARQAQAAQQQRQAEIQKNIDFENAAIDRLNAKIKLASESSTQAVGGQLKQIGQAFGEGLAQSQTEIDALVSRLQAELKTATGDEALSILSQLLNAEKALKDAEQFKRELQVKFSGAAVLIPVELTQVETESDSNFEAIAKKVQDDFKKSIQDNAPKQDIYDLLGINISDEDKKAISDALNFAKQQLASYAAERTRIAEQNVQASQAEVAAAENFLNRQTELQAAGLANQVETAEQQLQLAQNQQNKALKQQERAQQRERNLQTVQDAANLVSASAKIFKQVGSPLLAIPLIAFMFGSFAAAKISASRAAKKRLGKGGTGIIGGGTHASGNDTSLGIIENGREVFAEKGERYAVFNRKNTKKYDSILPTVIDSINAGTFENQFTAAGSAASDIQVNVPGSATSMDRTENELSQIRKQGEERTYRDGKGRLVKVYRGTTTTYV